MHAWPPHLDCAHCLQFTEWRLAARREPLSLRFAYTNHIHPIFVSICRVRDPRTYAGFVLLVLLLPALPLPLAGVAGQAAVTEGLLGTYYADADFVEEVSAQVDPQVDFDWGNGAPGFMTVGSDGDINDGFSVRWVGALTLPASWSGTTWNLSTESDDGSRVWLDGELVLDNWATPPFVTTTQLPLPAQDRAHHIRVEFQEVGGSASMHLRWSGPGGTALQAIPSTALTPPGQVPPQYGLLGTYYADRSSTELAFQRVDSGLSFDWGNGAPDGMTAGSDGVVADGFSVEWSGTLRLPAEWSGSDWTLQTESDDGSQVWLDDVLVLDNLATPPFTKQMTVTLDPNQRTYDIRVRFEEDAGYASMHLRWAPPGSNNLVPIPAHAFLLEHGIAGTYHPEKEPRSVSFRNIDERIDFHWGAGGPSGLLPGRDGHTHDHFSATWEGQLVIPSDWGTGQQWTLSVVSDDGSRVYLDGALAIDNWGDHPPRREQTSVDIITANQVYDLELEYYEKDGGASLSLEWAAPGSTQWAPVPANAFVLPSADAPYGAGLEGSYFTDSFWGRLEGVQIDPQVDMDWSRGPPSLLAQAGLTTEPYSVRWTGRIALPDTWPPNAAWKLGTESDGPSRVWLDGSVILKNEAPSRSTKMVDVVGSAPGQFHTIQVDYKDPGAQATMRLLWTQPGGSVQPVPAGVLHPDGAPRQQIPLRVEDCDECEPIATPTGWHPLLHQRTRGAAGHELLVATDEPGADLLRLMGDQSGRNDGKAQVAGGRTDGKPAGLLQPPGGLPDQVVLAGIATDLGGDAREETVILTGSLPTGSLRREIFDTEVFSRRVREDTIGEVALTAPPPGLSSPDYFSQRITGLVRIDAADLDSNGNAWFLLRNDDHARVWIDGTALYDGTWTPENGQDGDPPHILRWNGEPGWHVIEIEHYDKAGPERLTLEMRDGNQGIIPVGRDRAKIALPYYDGLSVSVVATGSGQTTCASKLQIPGAYTSATLLGVDLDDDARTDPVLVTVSLTGVLQMRTFVPSPGSGCLAVATTGQSSSIVTLTGASAREDKLCVYTHDGNRQAKTVPGAQRAGLSGPQLISAGVGDPVGDGTAIVAVSMASIFTCVQETGMDEGRVRRTPQLNVESTVLLLAYDGRSFHVVADVPDKDLTPAAPIAATQTWAQWKGGWHEGIYQEFRTEAETDVSKQVEVLTPSMSSSAAAQPWITQATQALLPTPVFMDQDGDGVDELVIGVDWWWAPDPNANVERRGLIEYRPPWSTRYAAHDAWTVPVSVTVDTTGQWAAHAGSVVPDSPCATLASPYTRSGAGLWGGPVPVRMARGTAADLSAGDIDGDNRDELLCPGPEGPVLLDHDLVGVLGGGPAHQIPSDKQSGYRAILADLTHDARPELQVVTEGQHLTFTWNGKASSFELDAQRALADTGRPGRTTLLLPVDIDNDGIVVQWNDQPDDHLKLLTNPLLLATLAAPPVVEGVQEGWGSVELEIGGSRCQSTETASSQGYMFGGGLSYSLGAGVGYVQRELEIDVTYAVERSYEQSQTKGTCFDSGKSWTASGPDDYVLFRQFPQDVYRYEVVSHPDENQVGGEFLVVLAGKPQVTFWPIREYNDAATFYNDNLGPYSEILGEELESATLVPSDHYRHVIGDPRTYPTPAQRDAELRNDRIPADPDIPLVVGEDGTFRDVADLMEFRAKSATQTATLSNSQGSVFFALTKSSGSSNTFHVSQTLDLSLALGKVKFVGALMTGMSETWSVEASNTQGFAASVPAIPTRPLWEEHVYDWGMYTYPRQLDDQVFPVIDFWVDQYQGRGPIGPVREAPNVVSPSIGEERFIQPTLAFEPVDGAAHYEVRLTTPTQLTSPVVATDEFQSSQSPVAWVPPGPLSLNHAYTFSVRAVNAVGAPGPWTHVPFAMVDAPDKAPVVTVSGAEAHHVVLSWTPFVGFGHDELGAATSYEVRWRERGSAWSDGHNATDAVPWTTLDLRPGSYELQVRAINGAGPGPWSQLHAVAVHAFPGDVTVRPTVPSGLLFGHFPVLWNEPDHASRYEVELDGHRHTTADRLWEPAVPTSPGHHIVRVRGINAAGFGPWSDPLTLALEEGPTAKVGPLRAQIDGERRTSPVTWDATNNTTWYDVEVAHSRQFGSTVSGYAVTNASFEPRDLVPGAYYVRVRAATTGGSGPWSEPLLFDVVRQPLGAPTPQMTENDGHERFPMTWAPIEGISRYDVEAQPKDLGQTITSRVAAPAWYGDGVSPGTYTVRVRATTPTGPGPWSEALPVAVGRAPTTSPLVSGTTVEHEVRADTSFGTLTETITFVGLPLSWPAVPGAKAYDVEVAVTTDFAPVLHSRTVQGQGTEESWGTGALTSGEYVVRVRGVNGTGLGPWSNPVFVFVASSSDQGLPGPALGLILLCLLGIALRRGRWG